MTDEEIDALIQEMSDELDTFPDDPENVLTKKEKTHKLVLELRKQTLQKVKDAKEKGNLNQEAKACMDYSLLTKYGEKHPLWMSFLKSQMGWWWGI